MRKYKIPPLFFLSLVLMFTGKIASAQSMKPSSFSFSKGEAWLCMMIIVSLLLLVAAVALKRKVSQLRENARRSLEKTNTEIFHEYSRHFNSTQIDKLLKIKNKKGPGNTGAAIIALMLSSIFVLFSPAAVMAQAPVKADGSSIFSEGGIIITLVLILIPVLAGFVLLIVKLRNAVNKQGNRQRLDEAAKLATYLENMTDEERANLEKRKNALNYSLTHNELSGNNPAEDERGLLDISPETGYNLVAHKKKALPRPNIDPELSKMVLWYLGCATFWLLFGTTIGEYLGIKFVAPDADHVSWLSFGRLRPVHTNAVFWGWASLGMIGLGNYIVPRVSNTKLFSMKMGWYALILINASVLIGSLCLMGGINNGGGEYREYIWPVMLLFGIGLALTLINFLKTIAKRTTKEIYISNWYMVSAIIFTIVISLTAYLPFWQDGLGETIVQGYYMHQGVGMWFMLFTLGIVYYFLPQQLNRPIYSYSLGILAFWTQILFYTLIGSHHFVFSAIPWWLQTVAIVGSMGMAIPVIAGTTNFLMTFKGGWYKVKDSYTLPFFLVGIIFYFTGSMQGTAEAFRFTNLIWHFTDFTVAHSHLTMYGIITFFIWACTYAVVPRLTGKEPPQILVGAHFWMALIGLMFYTIPLMYGSTLKGLLWLNGKPFMDGVVLMMPYWLWRAIGGSLMWLSHVVFAYNIYLMYKKSKTVDVRESAIEKMETDKATEPVPSI